jgi:hypothetical protein
VRRAGHVHNGVEAVLIGYWWESQKEGDHVEDQDIGGWMILKWMLETYDGVDWMGTGRGLL